MENFLASFSLDEVFRQTLWRVSVIEILIKFQYFRRRMKGWDMISLFCIQIRIN